MKKKHQKSIDEILSLLRISELTPYIGENVSQLAHSLQCAKLAADARADDEVIIGGPFSADEAEVFASSSLFRDKLRVRSWDERAKIVDWKVPGLETYQSLLAQHLKV